MRGFGPLSTRSRASGAVRGVAIAHWRPLAQRATDARPNLAQRASNARFGDLLAHWRPLVPGKSRIGGRFVPRGGRITHLARFRSKESRARCPSRHTAPLPPAPFRLKAIEGALNRFQAQRGVTLGPQVGRGPQPAYRPQPAHRPQPHAKGEAAAAASPAQPHDPRALRPRRRWSLPPTRRAFRWRCKSRRKARRWRTTPAQRQPPPAEPPR